MVVESKQDVRQRLRAQRDAISASTRAALSSRIARHFLEHAVARSADRIALYAPIGSEVDTGAIFSGLRQRGTEVCYPRSLTDRGVVEMCPVEDLELLRPGAYGVAEPEGGAVPVDSIDAVVLPGLAFDREGGRLGYGAGYYDRTLAAYRGRCIGLAFDGQLVERLPVLEHDRRMDVVVTESGATDVLTESEPVSSLQGGPP